MTHFILHFAALPIGKIIKYKNTLFIIYYFLKCYKVKRILISFTCFSEYIFACQIIAIDSAGVVKLAWRFLNNGLRREKNLPSDLRTTKAQISLRIRAD